VESLTYYVQTACRQSAGSIVFLYLVLALVGLGMILDFGVCVFGRVRFVVLVGS
jgi:hypothetical protein